MAIKNSRSSDASSASIDWAARARGVVPVIEAAIDRIESEGRIPADVMSALHDAELFRMCLPPWLGGGEATPRWKCSQVSQIIAAADASTAWCLGQALGCSRMAGFLDRSVAKEVFGSPDADSGLGSARRQAPKRSRSTAGTGSPEIGGWSSGIRNANLARSDLFGLRGRWHAATRRRRQTGHPDHAAAHLEREPSPMYGASSGSRERAAIASPSTICSCRRPTPCTATRRWTGARMDSLYRLGLSIFYAVAFAGVALGVARSALDDFIPLSAAKEAQSLELPCCAKIPAPSVSSPRRRRSLGSARSYLVDMLDAAWNSGHPPDAWPVELRARLRLSCRQRNRSVTRSVVEFAYQAAGSDAIFQDNPFERRLRDINTAAQQAQGQPVNFEHAGAALMGSGNRRRPGLVEVAVRNSKLLYFAGFAAAISHTNEPFPGSPQKHRTLNTGNRIALGAPSLHTLR